MSKKSKNDKKKDSKADVMPMILDSVLSRSIAEPFILKKITSRGYFDLGDYELYKTSISFLIKQLDSLIKQSKGSELNKIKEKLDTLKDLLRDFNSSRWNDEYVKKLKCFNVNVK